MDRVAPACQQPSPVPLCTIRPSRKSSSQTLKHKSVVISCVLALAAHRQQVKTLTCSSCCWAEKAGSEL